MIIDRLGTAAVVAMGLVLLFAGTVKLRRPIRRLDRPLGGLELAVGTLALLAPGALAGPPLALVFTAFAIVHVRAGTDENCGCLGEKPSARGVRALALTAAPAALAVATTVRDPPGLLDLAGRHPAAAGPVAGLAVLTALAWDLAFRPGPRRLTLAGAGERLVTSSAMFLERRISRRSVLMKIAVGGSALTVAPVRYLLYPISAMAAIVPGDCGGGLCTDGYTAFCCEINHGLNTCPTGTFPGGWWMCTDYQGRLLCRDEGVRYYVDCNRRPGIDFPGGCHCANNNCDERRVACNVFRYGQCNPQIPGVTEVVCRMIVCENPGRIPGLNCNSSVAVDNAVCGHDVPCLTGDAVEVGLAGGV